VVWNFERANGTVGLAGFERSERSVAVYAPHGANQTRGALRTDVFFTTRDDRATCGSTIHLARAQKIAEGEGVGRISVGFSSPFG